MDNRGTPIGIPFKSMQSKFSTEVTIAQRNKNIYFGTHKKQRTQKNRDLRKNHEQGFNKY